MLAGRHRRGGRRVGGEERLDRQLAGGDLDRGAEGRDGADERQVAAARPNERSRAPWRLSRVISMSPSAVVQPAVTIRPPRRTTASVARSSPP